MRRLESLASQGKRQKRTEASTGLRRAEVVVRQANSPCRIPERWRASVSRSVPIQPHRHGAFLYSRKADCTPVQGPAVIGELAVRPDHARVSRRGSGGTGPAVAVEKTIRRDIRHWRDMGYPIQQVETANADRPKVWKLDRSLMKVPKLPIGVVELLAFSAGRELLYPLAGTPYWDGIQKLWERMRESTSPDVLRHLDQQRAGLIVRGPMPKDYSRQEGMLSALNRAVYEHRVAEVKYKGLGQPRPRKRRIEPHAICLFLNSIYVLAADADEIDGPIKTYKLDRVSSVDLLDRRFTPRKDFDPDVYFDNSIGIFREASPSVFGSESARERAAWRSRNSRTPNGT